MTQNLHLDILILQWPLLNNKYNIDIDNLGKDKRVEILDKASSQSSEQEEFALSVLSGLSSSPKKIDCAYLYDVEGSNLFAKIMTLKEYYLSKCEAEIFTSYKQDIIASLNSPFDIVDLGAGNGQKTNILIQAAKEQQLTYIPVDISKSAMLELLNSYSKQHRDLDIYGLIGDYDNALNWLQTHRKNRPKLFLLLGSNIGIFNPIKARLFLQKLWMALSYEDRLLIGFDLKKTHKPTDASIQ